jgi:DNA-directed RNA polymerase subunit RPC12/RpoP
MSTILGCVPCRKLVPISDEQIKKNWPHECPHCKNRLQWMAWASRNPAWEEAQRQAWILGAPS